MPSRRSALASGSTSTRRQPAATHTSEPLCRSFGWPTEVFTSTEVAVMTSALVLRAPRLFAGTDQLPVANGALGLVGTRIVAAGSIRWSDLYPNRCRWWITQTAHACLGLPTATLTFLSALVTRPSMRPFTILKRNHASAGSGQRTGRAPVWGDHGARLRWSGSADTPAARGCPPGDRRRTRILAAGMPMTTTGWTLALLRAGGRRSPRGRQGRPPAPQARQGSISSRL